MFAQTKRGAGAKPHRWKLKRKSNGTFINRAVRTVLSSFTAPRGPLSPLGNVKGCGDHLLFLQRILFGNIILRSKKE